MSAKTTWLFGLPCSGKTTLGSGLVGANGVHLDGDYLRETVNEDLEFTQEDRTENLRRAAGIAQMLNEQNVDVVASFITPYREQREMIAEKVDNVQFVHVHAPVETCEDRDVKGMYRQARNGEIENFTGISAPFEDPEPDADVLKVRTDTHSRTETLTEINEELGLKSKPTNLFMGRWQPFHDGHKTIIDSFVNNGEDVTIAIRDTELSDDNPFTIRERREMIEDVYGDNGNVEVITIPDIDTVAVGREVGYSLVTVPEEVKEISGTETRENNEREEMLEGKHRSTAQDD